MIAWAIIWFLLLGTVSLLIAMEIINGSLEWRFWVCVFLIFVIIIIPSFTITEYTASVEFYEEYQAFCHKVEKQKLTPSQEYMIVGEATNQNYFLYRYQSKIQKWGILAPTYRKIKDLKPIELTTFNMNDYRWWE